MVNGSRHDEDAKVMNPAATPNNEQEELPEETSILNTSSHSVGSTDAGMRPRSRSGGRYYLFNAIFCFGNLSFSISLLFLTTLQRET